MDDEKWNDDDFLNRGKHPDVVPPERIKSLIDHNYKDFDRNIPAGISG